MNTSESMPKTMQPKDPDAPLYIRWIPDSCPYALEMRLNLMPRLNAELEDARLQGRAAGGVFFGVFPTSHSPTLRLEELLFVPGDRNNGTLDYELTGEQLARLSEITAQARFTERPAVGFFRSHLGVTQISPAKSDLAILSLQFGDGQYAFLTIDNKSPREGTFYLAMNGDVPEMPSTGAFPLDETAFKSLPEVPAEATEDVRNFGIGRTTVRRPLPWAAVASLVILLFLVGLWTFGSRISQAFRPASNQIDLNVLSSGTSLKIAWDHSSPAILKALGATIIIMDGAAHREVRLDSDDLRLGQIAYERLTRKVYVVMRLDAPGTKLPPQTFDWTGD